MAEQDRTLSQKERKMIDDAWRKHCEAAPWLQITKTRWVNDNGLVFARLPNGSASFDIFDAANWNGDKREGLALAALIARAPALAPRVEELEAENDRLRSLLGQFAGEARAALGGK